MTSTLSQDHLDTIATVTPAGQRENINPHYSDDKSVEHNEHTKLMNDKWGTSSIDHFADEAIKKATAFRNDTGIMFDLINGHSIQWLKIGQQQYIGCTEKGQMDGDDARAIISLAKTHGWGSVNVHGSIEDREQLWLEAQRQGLAVTNFAPLQGSDVARIWAEEAKLIEAAKKQEELATKMEGAHVTDGGPEQPIAAKPQQAEAPVQATAEAVAPEAAAEVTEPSGPNRFEVAQMRSEEAASRFVQEKIRENPNLLRPAAPATPAAPAAEKPEVKAAAPEVQAEKTAEQSKFAAKNTPPAAKPKTNIKELKAMRNQHQAEQTQKSAGHFTKTRKP